MDKAENNVHHVYCWSCGNKTIQPTKTWFTCTNCGATYCDVLRPGIPTVVEGNIILTVGTSQVKIRAKHPTRTVAREVAKARTDSRA